MDLKIFKTKKHFKKSEHQPNPDLYWRIVLFVTMFLIVASLVFGARLYFEIESKDFSPAVEYSGQGKKISKERLDKVLLYFTERAERAQQILNSSRATIDPSI